MYCPKCGEPLEEKEGKFVCVSGNMELSATMATHLYACFVSQSEQPEELEFTKEGYRVGGHWFCPGCGILMHEESPGAVRCPKCNRNIAMFLNQLVELPPHGTVRPEVMMAAYRRSIEKVRELIKSWPNK